jgi:hypothetical protein
MYAKKKKITWILPTYKEIANVYDKPRKQSINLLPKKAVLKF